MSGAALIALAGFSFVPRLEQIANVSTSLVPGVSRVAGVHFHVDGSLESVTGNDASPTVTPRPGYWCVPQGGDFFPGNQYELLATVISGTLDVGLTGSWIDLGIFAPLYLIRQTGGSLRETEVVFSIRDKITLTHVAFGSYFFDLVP